MVDKDLIEFFYHHTISGNEERPKEKLDSTSKLILEAFKASYEKKVGDQKCSPDQGASFGGTFMKKNAYWPFYSFVKVSPRNPKFEEKVAKSRIFQKKLKTSQL